MPIRRRSVLLLPWAPLGGVPLLAGCSDKAAPPAAGTAPTSAPAPTPAPAPTSPAPTAPPTMPPAPVLVSPSDAQARTLGYVPLTGQADATAYKTHASSQFCSNCTHYSGKAGEASGPCPVMGGRLVSAQGWCSRWARKA